MKKIFMSLLCLMAGYVNAQQGVQEQIKELKDKSDKFNVFLNFQTSLDALTPKDEDTELGFKARQLRLEFRGNINEKIFYRLRHRLNRPNSASSLDNLARATDMMYAGFHIDPKWTITAGKMCQAWGGFEFDLNPMNIYEYSDMVDNMDNFMMGGMVTYMPNNQHEFNFQITNSRNQKFDEIYGSVADIQASKSPLTYILNWNGNLLDGKLQTRWAYGIQTEAKSTYNNMLTLGTKLNLPKFQIFLDYMREDDDLDRLGYAAVQTSPYTFQRDVTYNSFISKAEYQPSEKWNIFVQGMYETADVKESALIKDDNRRSFGYYCGVEYLPFKDQDLRFFAAYVGRKWEYDTHLKDTYTNRFSIGMMYRIKAF